MTAHCANCRTFHDTNPADFPPDKPYVGHVEHCTCMKRLKCQIGLVHLPMMSRSR